MKQSSGSIDLIPCQTLWQAPWERMSRSLVACFSSAVLLALLFPAILPAANIGTVVSVIGQAADLVYDSQRNQVYISNLQQNRVEVYSVAQQRQIGRAHV